MGRDRASCSGLLSPAAGPDPVQRSPGPPWQEIAQIPGHTHLWPCSEGTTHMVTVTPTDPDTYPAEGQLEETAVSQEQAVTLSHRGTVPSQAALTH